MNNVGKIVQIIGPVLDIRFEDCELPNILNAIEIDNKGQRLVAVTEYKMFQGILYVFSKTLPKTIPQPPYQAFGTYLKKSDSCFAFPLFIYFVATFTPFSA